MLCSAREYTPGETPTPENTGAEAVSFHCASVSQGTERVATRKECVCIWRFGENTLTEVGPGLLRTSTG